MPDRPPSALEFRGGPLGALVPLLLFVTGVGALAFSGAPDERGFWPVLLAALAAGLALCRRPREYADRALAGMSQPIVLLMVVAWLLAGVLGSLMNASGFVDALVWVARAAGLSGGAYVCAAFVVAALVSTATGTSLGTVILCGPLLYPAGGPLGAAPAVLMGALLGGATFGDNVSPVSDTTIASASTQGATLGAVVRSRLRYALPAAALALVAYAATGSAAGPAGAPAAAGAAGAGPALRALPMLLAPALVIVLLVAGRHLMEGLLAGSAVAAALSLALGLLQPGDLVAIDRARYTAGGLIVTGMERGIGVSIFTLLLMGLVGGLEASGLPSRVLSRIERSAVGARGAEARIVTAVSVAVLLTTHSVVALLTVGPFARRLGERLGLPATRRANLLDLTVCTYPFLLPWCIPTILAASVTAGAAGMPRLSPAAIGLANAHSWALLAMLLLAVAGGYGRRGDRSAPPSNPDPAGP